MTSHTPHTGIVTRAKRKTTVRPRNVIFLVCKLEENETIYSELYMSLSKIYFILSYE